MDLAPLTASAPPVQHVNDTQEVLSPGVGWRTRVAALAAVVGLVACSGSDEGTTPTPETPLRRRDELPDVRAEVHDLAVAAGVGDPNKVEMPPPDEELAAWLVEAGSLAPSFVTTVEGLLSSEPDCDAVAAALDALGSPEILLATISETPDEPTRDVFMGTYSGALRALATCGTPDFGKEQASFAWQWSVADSRVRQVTS